MRDSVRARRNASKRCGVSLRCAVLYGVPGPSPRGARDLRRSTRCTSLSGWSRSARLRPFSSPPVAARGQPPPRPAWHPSARRLRARHPPASPRPLSPRPRRRPTTAATRPASRSTPAALATRASTTWPRRASRTPRRSASRRPSARRRAPPTTRRTSSASSTRAASRSSRSASTRRRRRSRPSRPTPTSRSRRSTRSGTRPTNGPTPANFSGLDFQIDEAATLAGYLAAGFSKSGIIGTYGGQQFPGVTRFMDGMAAGINIYNEKKSKDVSLLGWDAGHADRHVRRRRQPLG